MPHTVEPFLIGKALSLLSLVPIDDKTVSESQRGTGVRSSVSSSARVGMVEPQRRAYSSSQLNRDLAKVVSMCLTASDYCERVSQPALQPPAKCGTTYLEFIFRRETTRRLLKGQEKSYRQRRDLSVQTSSSCGFDVSSWSL